MAKMKKTYSYEWYGPCGYEEKEDSKDGASEEVHDSNVFTSRCSPSTEAADSHFNCICSAGTSAVCMASSLKKISCRESCSSGIQN